MIWNDMQWFDTHCHSCWCNDMQGEVVLYWHSLPFLMPTYWMDMYWMDTCVLTGYVLNRYLLKGYVLKGFWMDTYWNDTYWNDTYWNDMCLMMLIEMHCMIYANNLLKNPATKRISGKTICAIYLLKPLLLPVGFWLSKCDVIQGAGPETLSPIRSCSVMINRYTRANTKQTTCCNKKWKTCFGTKHGEQFQNNQATPKPSKSRNVWT